LHGELLVKQVCTQISTRAIQQTGFHCGFPHAFDELTHEKRLKLFGCFLD
jgi:hypothetical protein